MADHLCVLLLGALNEDFVVVIGNLHRIETYDLAQGLVDRQVAEMTGDGEVLQFVVDEIDGLVADGRIQVFEHFRQRFVLIVACQSLGAETQGKATQQCCEYIFFHHGVGLGYSTISFLFSRLIWMRSNLLNVSMMSSMVFPLSHVK